MHPFRMIATILAVVCLSAPLAAQNHPGYPRWPLTTSNGCRLVDFVPSPPTQSTILSCNATAAGGTGAAFDCCGLLTFYVLNTGVLDHYQLQAFSNTGSLTLVHPNHQAFTEQGFEGIAGDNEIQVVPVPNQCRRWFIIYSRYEDGHTGYTPANICYSRVEFDPDHPTELIVHEKDVVLQSGGTPYTYIHGKAVSKSGLNDDAATRILYACRRTVGTTILSIDRWIISGSPDQIVDGAPANTGDVNALWYPISALASSLELSNNGGILAVSNRNEAANSNGSPQFILFKTETFNNQPANCTSIYLYDQVLADVDGQPTLQSRSGDAGYAYLANLSAKVAGIQFSTDGKYLWFTGGGFHTIGATNCTYLGQLDVSTLNSGTWSTTGKTTGLPLRAQVQHPHATSTTSYAVDDDGCGESTGTDADYQQLGNIQRAYDGKFYFTKTNSSTLFAIPSPDAALATNLPTRTWLNQHRTEMDIDISPSDNITLQGDVSNLPDQMDGYVYVTNSSGPIVVTATPATTNLGGTITLTANQPDGTWTVNQGPPPSGGGTISGSGSSATFVATASGNVVITYTITDPSNNHCTGTANIWVNGPACPQAVTSPFPGQNCCFLFRVKNDNPQLESVDRLDLHVATSGITFSSVSAFGPMNGWTITGTGADRSFQGGTAIAAADWIESVMMCFQPPSSTPFTVTWATYHGTENVCRGTLTLDCIPCDLQVTSLQPDSHCACPWKLTMTNPTMINRVVIKTTTPGVTVLETSDPTVLGSDWHVTGTPYPDITYQGGDPVPAGTQKSIEFCISASGMFTFTTYFDDTRICTDSLFLQCKPQPPVRDCCDSLLFDRDVTISSSTLSQWCSGYPDYVEVRGRIASSRPLTRFAVINERTTAVIADAQCNPIGIRDVTGYISQARGGNNPWIHPADGWNAGSPIPMTPDNLTHAAGYTPYGFYNSGYLSGGPREVRWNSQTSYECSNLPYGIPNSNSKFAVRLAWQPNELPALPATQHYCRIEYTLRCEFTDTTCRTCWSRISGSVKFPHAWVDPHDTTTMGSIAMADASNGTLTITPPVIADSAAGLRYIALRFQPEAGIALDKFLDDAGLFRAVISDNAATISMDHAEGMENTYTIQVTNGGGGSFHADVTLYAVKTVSPEDTLMLHGTLFAHVPLRGGEAQDSLAADPTIRPVSVKTYSLYFVSANARNEAAKWIILRPKGGSSIIAVGPPPDTTSVALSLMQAKTGEMFLLPFKDEYVRDAVLVTIKRGPKQPRAIIITMSGVTGSDAVIGYASINDKGDTISVGEVILRDPLETSIAPDGDPRGSLTAPGELCLRPMYPNPASHSVTLQYATSGPLRNATLTVSDLSGRIVETVFEDATLGTGEQAIVYDTSRLPAGTYFFTLRSGTASQTRSFRVVR